MFWIEGIRHDTQGFSLEVIEPKLGRRNEALRQLSQPLKPARTIRKRVTTDCGTWTRESGTSFWRQIGIEAFKPKDGQGVFRFCDDGKVYLVPASVFIAAMMRPIHLIQAYLFKPQGLESFCTPLLDCKEPQLGLHVSSTKVFGTQHNIPKGLWATYSWMHCFPSAHAMWSSVYTAALQGRLDIALPKADLNMTVRSVKAGNVRLVTDMLITKLEALEAPFRFADSHTRDIVMHESSELDWKMLHRPTSVIPPRGGEWRLSDAEWHAVEPLFTRRVHEKFSPRAIVDLILIKLGTGQAWRKMDFGTLNLPIVQATYQRLQKQGQWRILETTLATLRSPMSKLG